MGELKALSKLKMAGKLHYWSGTIEIDERELHEICDEIQAEHDKAVTAMNGVGEDDKLNLAERLQDIATRMRTCAMCNHVQEIEEIAATLGSGIESERQKRFVVCVPKDKADRFIARSGKENISIQGFLLNEEDADVVGECEFKPFRGQINEIGEREGVCSNCSAYMHEQFNFCSNCGKKVKR